MTVAYGLVDGDDHGPPRHPHICFDHAVLSSARAGTWGRWAHRAELLAPNSEFAVAELGGRLYILGGYPADRVTVTTVQVYDIATDKWTPGPDLPKPNNHGMAVGVNGTVSDWRLRPKLAGRPHLCRHGLRTGSRLWVFGRKRRGCRRAALRAWPSSMTGFVHVAGGRPPHGHDFAVYDPAADRWEKLPDLPSQRNHIAGGGDRWAHPRRWRPARRRLSLRPDRRPRGVRSQNPGMECWPHPCSARAVA